MPNPELMRVAHRVIATLKECPQFSTYIFPGPFGLKVIGHIHSGLSLGLRKHLVAIDGVYGIELARLQQNNAHDIIA